MDTKEVGSYILETQLGKGGMGEVFLGRHKSLDTRAAIKVMTPQSSGEAEFRERFHREAKTQAQLSHPHIARVLDHVEKDGRWYLITEYMEKGTLKDVLDQTEGPVPPARAVAWVRQALEGLDHAHQQGIVHRDIKPANILLDTRDEAAVTDFGLAKLLGDAATEGTTPEQRLTSTGMSMGTPEYMSPEQILASDTLDARTDLYAMGVVLYELLTGRVPLAIKSVHELQRVLVQPPPPPRDLNPDISEELEGIVLRALAKTPEERWQRAADFAAALRAWERGVAGSVPGVIAADPDSTVRLQAPIVDGETVATTQVAAASPPPLPPPPPPPPPTSVGPETTARSAAALPLTDATEPDTVIAPGVAPPPVPSSGKRTAWLDLALITGALAVLAALAWFIVGRMTGGAPAESIQIAEQLPADSPTHLLGSNADSPDTTAVGATAVGATAVGATAVDADAVAVDAAESDAVGAMGKGVRVTGSHSSATGSMASSSVRPSSVSHELPASGVSAAGVTSGAGSTSAPQSKTASSAGVKATERSAQASLRSGSAPADAAPSGSASGTRARVAQAGLAQTPTAPTDKGRASVPPVETTSFEPAGTARPTPADAPARLAPPAPTPLPEAPVVAVLAVGHPDLAQPLEAELVDRLRALRHEVGDPRSDLALSDLLRRAGARLGTSEAADLARNAGFHILAIARIEPVGSRQVAGAVATTSRIRLDVFRLPDARSLGSWTENVEHVPLNVQEKAEQAFLRHNLPISETIHDGWADLVARHGG